MHSASQVASSTRHRRLRPQWMLLATTLHVLDGTRDASQPPFKAFCRMAKPRRQGLPRCAAVVSVAPGLVPTAVFPQLIKDLRPPATAGNAYWQPPKRARGVVGVVPVPAVHCCQGRPKWPRECSTRPCRFTPRRRLGLCRVLSAVRCGGSRPSPRMVATTSANCRQPKGPRRSGWARCLLRQGLAGGPLRWQTAGLRHPPRLHHAVTQLAEVLGIRCQHRRRR